MTSPEPREQNELHLQRITVLWGREHKQIKAGDDSKTPSEPLVIVEIRESLCVVLPSCSGRSAEQTASHSRAGSSCWHPSARSSWCQWAAGNGCRWNSSHANCCPYAPSFSSLVGGGGGEREREKIRVGETQHLQLTMFSLCFHVPEFSHELNKYSYSRSHYTSGIQVSLHQLQLMAMCWFLLMACWQRLTKVIKSTVVPTG